MHEATFDTGKEADARRKKHSTVEEAMHIAKEAGAKSVVLTHFSQRYPRGGQRVAGGGEGGRVPVVKAMDFLELVQPKKQRQLRQHARSPSPPRR